MTSVSVVTGAAGAMGLACALALAPGDDVMLLTDVLGDRLERGRRAARRQRHCRGKVCAAAGDLSDPCAFVAGSRIERLPGASATCTPSSTPRASHPRWRGGARSCASISPRPRSCSARSCRTSRPAAWRCAWLRCRGTWSAFSIRRWTRSSMTRSLPISRLGFNRSREMIRTPAPPTDSRKRRGHPVVRAGRGRVGRARGAGRVALARAHRHRHGSPRADPQPDQGLVGRDHAGRRRPLGSRNGWLPGLADDIAEHGRVPLLRPRRARFRVRRACRRRPRCCDEPGSHEPAAMSNDSPIESSQEVVRCRTTNTNV